MASRIKIWPMMICQKQPAVLTSKIDSARSDKFTQGKPADESKPHTMRHSRYPEYQGSSVLTKKLR